MAIGTFNPKPVAHQTFGNPAISTSGSGDFQLPILARDLNGDGISDVLGYSADGLTVLLGQPGLTFSAPAHYAYVPEQNVYTDLSGDGLIAPVLGDFAHRGKLDAAYFLNESLYVVQGNGDGSSNPTPTMLATPTVSGVQANTFQALQVADFDGDGNLDIAFLSWYEPGAYFYQGGPSCVFIYFATVTQPSRLPLRQDASRTPTPICAS